MHLKHQLAPGKCSGKTQKKKIFEYFFVYTLIFVFVIFVVFFPFLTEKKSLIWKIDGMPQYLLWLKYTGDYIRNLFTEFLDGNFTLPMYDFSIGMGGDVRGFLKTDPFNLFGIFLSNENFSWEIYSLLTIVKIFIVGLSFSIYGFYMKQKRYNILAGAILYTFSSFTFYQIERHPQFYMGITLLPLLCIGLEQIMKKKKLLFYTLMVAVSLMVSYYFLFINTILMGIYVLFRIGMIYDTHRIRNFFNSLWRIIVSYLFGCGMSAMFFAPSIASFFLSARTSSGTKTAAVDSYLSYGADRIVKLFLSLIAPVRNAGSLTTITVSVLVIPVLILLFTRPVKQKFSLKTGVLLGIILLLFPVFGYVFSGFSTVNNRWSYGFIFLLSIVFMTEFERLGHITKKQYILLIASLILYGICWCLTDWQKTEYIFAFILLFLIIIILGLFRRYRDRLSRRTCRNCMLVLLILSVAANGFFINSPLCGNLVDQFQNRYTADQYFSSSRYQYLANISDDSFYRTDTDMMYNNYNNTAVALGYNGISLYSSTISSNIIQYYTESESVGISAVNRTLSLDNRTSQEALACVKYFITTEGNSRSVPYGFTIDQKLSDQSDEYDIYVNDYILPIGYSYDSVLSRSQYEELSALEKQQIQMKTAVIADEDMDSFQSLTEASSSDDLGILEGDFEVTGVDKGIVQDGNTYHVNKKRKTKTVTVDGVEEEVDVSPKVHFRTVSKAGYEVYLRFNNLSCNRAKRVDVNVSTDDLNKRVIVRSDKDTYNLGVNDYIINLGYYDSEEVIDGTISFSRKGIFSFDSIDIYYVPMSSYADDISALKEDSLENVSQSTNTITGTVNSSGERLMAFSIPYHIGWKAYIDGEETEIYNVNTLYMGIKIPEGTHNITLKYTSPGSVVGGVISCTCTFIFLVAVLIQWRKKRRIQQGTS